MLTAEQTTDIRDKNPGVELVLIEADDKIDLVFKKPPRFEYNRWINTSEADKSGAALQLAAACLVYPSYEQMIAALDKYPALLLRPDGIRSALLSLAGLDDEARKPKKL